MKKPLQALFYGQTHEHAPGKLETLKKMRDEYEIVAIVDDFPRKSPMYRDQKWDTADYPIVSEAEAWSIPDIDVGFVEVTNCDLMQIGYMYRTNPALKFIWDFVRKGHLGKIGFIEADMNHAYNHDNYAEYMQTFDGGILYSLGCHLVDMVEPMVKGEPMKVTRVLESAFGYPASVRTTRTMTATCASMI